MTLADKYTKPMSILVVGVGHSGANFTIRILDALGYPCGEIVDSRHGNDNHELFRASAGEWDNLDLTNIPPVVKSHNFGLTLSTWIEKGFPKPEYIIFCYRDPAEVQRRVSEEDGVERTHVAEEVRRHTEELSNAIQNHNISFSTLIFPETSDPDYFYDNCTLFHLDSISREEFKEAHKKIYNPDWAKGEKWK